MINKNKVIDSNELTMLLQDSTIVRIVNIIGNANLSILELLEYNLTRRDVNYALASGIIGIDKPPSSSSQSSLYSLNLDESNILVSGDYYFYNFLNSKVKLTDLGTSILETIRAVNKTVSRKIPKDGEGPQKQYLSTHLSSSEVECRLIFKSD